METKSLINASILTLLLVIGFIVCFEISWRSRGFVPTYNDDKVLWATKRNELRHLEGDATVFVGGSRIKFDLDVPTWEKVTGERAIQLAIVGTPPRLTLRELANDLSFKGKLIVDVAEMQFFGSDSVRSDRFAREALEYYREETPAQKASASINYFLESKLVFLEEGKFGLVNLLNTLKLTNRPGVTFRPPFPKEFSASNMDRQNWLTPMFLGNPKLIKIQIANWERGMSRNKPIEGEALDRLLAQIKTCTDKIRSRGGSVVFVRPPSTAIYLEQENKKYPRDKYWEKLLAVTKCQGIHFADYPATAQLFCPEWSHLTLKDAAIYTAAVAKILQQEKGWTFPNKINSIAQNPHP